MARQKKTKLDTNEAIRIATAHLAHLKGHILDVLTISRPTSIDAAVNLAKIVSKLSPILGNLIEFSTVDFLNQQKVFNEIGKWKRQDPGFPDAVFEGPIHPTPGFEIKAWFPLATEITARFKDSQKHFIDDQTYVVLLAWLPEQLIYGKPVVMDLCIVSGASVAKARDDHYHMPPHYLVVEPNDTTDRTANLQQTNTNGYVWQGTDDELVKAKEVVASWGVAGSVYSTDLECQNRIHDLKSRFHYRLDTNFAKTDRIRHAEIEKFKTRILTSTLHGLTIQEWSIVLASENNGAIEKALIDRIKWTP